MGSIPIEEPKTFKHISTTLSLLSLIAILLASNLRTTAQGTDQIPNPGPTASPASAAATNEIVRRALKEGNDALIQQNYDFAIAAYNQGLAAQQEPALYINKSLALRARGVERFNAGIKSTDTVLKKAAQDAAKKDWLDAADASAKALDVINATYTRADPAAKTNYEKLKHDAIEQHAESMRLVGTRVDTSRATEAFNIYSEYAAHEPDASKKSHLKVTAATIFLETGNFEQAIREFRTALAADPDSTDAMFYLGLALIGTANKGNLQEAADWLEQFLEKAPDTHPARADALSSLDFLKTENISPRKKRATVPPQNKTD